MAFLASPFEIILHILSYLSRPDHLNFALTCHRFHDVSYKCLLGHRTLFAQYCNIELVPGTNTYSHFLFFLRNPYLRFYPRYIDLGEYGSEQHDQSDSDLFEASEDEIAELAGYMRRTQNRVSWDRVDILWIGMIRKGSESPIIAMLMSLLPNLRRLRLTRLDDSLLLICPKLRLRRDAATFTTTFQDGDAGVASNMEKIKEVLVTPRNEHVRAPRLTLATVSPLLGLPALRTLSLEHVSDLGNIPEVRLPPCFGGVCSLETLILQNSHISIRNLRTFLRPVPALKSFSYSQTQGLCPELRSYADLIDVLGKKFGHTLEELSLGLPYTIFGYRGIPPGIKKFKVLRKLSFSNDEHSQYRDLVCEKGHPGREGIAHLFNEILPPSIEEFELKVQMRHDGSLRKMLRSVRAIRRPWPLPGLRKVSIRGNEKDQPFMWEGSERLSFQKSVQEYIQTGHLRLVEGRIACHT